MEKTFSICGISCCRGVYDRPQSLKLKTHRQICLGPLRGRRRCEWIGGEGGTTPSCA